MRDVNQIINQGNAIIAAKDNQIADLIDNNTDYLLKITSQHRELASLRNEVQLDNNIIYNLEEEIKDVTEKYNELIKVSTALVVIYLVSVAIVIGVVFFNY